jgi:hypothetical protein
MCDGMKNSDNKKLLLNLIILVAGAFSIAAILTPIASFDQIDSYESLDYGIPEEHWKIDSYVLFTHYNYVKGSQTGDRYAILHIFYYDTPEWIQIGPKGSWDSINIMSSLVFGSLGLVSYIFVLYKSFKICGKKKTKYFLYASIILIIIISAEIFILTLSLNSVYQGYADFIKLGYGFYYVITASILFIIGYFSQSYLVDFSKEKTNIEKVLFEKYKEN